jgi:hypothetical protein
VDTYRTLCLAPDIEIQRLLEGTIQEVANVYRTTDVVIRRISRIKQEDPGKVFPVSVKIYDRRRVAKKALEDDCNYWRDEVC